MKLMQKNLMFAALSCVATALFPFLASAQTNPSEINPNVRCTLTGNGIDTDSVVSYVVVRNFDFSFGGTVSEWGYVHAGGNPGLGAKATGSKNPKSPNIRIKQDGFASRSAVRVDVVAVNVSYSPQILELVRAEPGTPNPKFNAVPQSLKVTRQQLTDGFQTTISVPVVGASSTQINNVDATLNCRYDANAVPTPLPPAPPSPPPATDYAFGCIGVKAGETTEIKVTPTGFFGRCVQLVTRANAKVIQVFDSDINSCDFRGSVFALGPNQLTVAIDRNAQTVNLPSGTQGVRLNPNGCNFLKVRVY